MKVRTVNTLAAKIQPRTRMSPINPGETGVIERKLRGTLTSRLELAARRFVGTGAGYVR
jgi:hypothetical protein